MITEKMDFSIEFIREMKENINWPQQLRKKFLSDDLLIEFNDYINWNLYFNQREASFLLLKKYLRKTSFTFSNEFNTSHLNDYEYKEINKILKLKNLFSIK
jgi:hypothetical protein